MNVKKIMIIFIALLLSHTVFALKPLVVISDSGGESIEKYIVKVTKQNEDDWEKDAKNLSIPEPIKDFDPNTRFPIITKEMKVGKVKNRNFNHPVGVGAQFAIVGFDKYSWNWMKQKRSVLEKNGMKILVVNVKTPEQLDAIRELMSKNMVDAVPGTDIAKQLNISRYPVMINDKGISQ